MGGSDRDESVHDKALGQGREEERGSAEQASRGADHLRKGVREENGVMSAHRGLHHHDTRGRCKDRGSAVGG
jgi:hypothetical protein